MWFYATRTAGIGGIIKQKPYDFVVREVTSREEGDNGEFLIAELKKVNWDTHSVIRELAKRLRVSRNRFGFAGTKDKFAVTTQKISIWGINADDLARIRLRDVTLRVLGRSNKPVSLGDLYGNEFEIVIRGLKLNGGEREILERLNCISAEIAELGGVPNFFGVQRFGVTRPITHIVGEHLIRGDIRGAVMTYLSCICPGESEEVKEARQLCHESRFKECLKRMPLRYERAMLNELVKKGEPDESDYIAAFKALPVNLQKLFIHAYQAYLFNLVLSRRMELQLPFNEAMVGDIVCYRNERGFADPDKVERVTEAKQEAINRLIKRGRAFVTAPVFGYASELGTGLEGDIEREVLATEGVELSDFKLGIIPAMSSRGTRRPILVPVDVKINCGCGTALADDELNPGSGYKRVKLCFFLPKGAYATVVLREYMKT